MGRRPCLVAAYACNCVQPAQALKRLVIGRAMRSEELGEYVREYRRSHSREAVAVFIPEYVVGHWWEHLLHNQSALWLKSRLLFSPGVMVISVPWQLSSAPGADHPARRAPGAVRRGEPTPRMDVPEPEKL